MLSVSLMLTARNDASAAGEINSRGRERGLVLVIVLMLITVLTLVGTTAFMTSSTDLKISGNYRQGFQAFHDAEAGIHAVFAKILEGGVTFPQATGGEIGLSCTVPSGFAFDDAVSLKHMGNKRYLIQIAGRSGAASKVLEVVFRRKSAFEYGLFAEGNVDLQAGSGIYSYDSRVTPHPDPADYPAHSTGRSDVASNTQVQAYNGTYIDGDVALGASAAAVDALYATVGTPVISGHAGELTGRIDPDPLGAIGGNLAAKFVAFSAANDNALIAAPPGVLSGTAIQAGNLDTVTLTGKAGGANFYLSGITLESGATLTIDVAAGPVNIYLAGPLLAKNGSIVTVNDLPTAFTILSNSTGSIRLLHNSAFKGMIYAPYAPVEIKNGADVFGAIRGNTIDIKNSGQFFFDEASKEHLPANGVVPLAWRDVH